MINFPFVLCFVLFFCVCGCGGVCVCVCFVVVVFPDLSFVCLFVF